MSEYTTTQVGSATIVSLPHVQALELRRVTEKAFLARFTDAEAVTIDLASIGATAEAAGVRRYLNLVGASTFIALDDPATVGGVQALEAAGLIGAGRADEILGAPIQAGERP